MPDSRFNFVSQSAAMLSFAVALLLAARVSAATSEHVDFNFQIRPILSDRCFKCHGPDPKSRKGDLRLDTAEGGLAICDKKTGARAIVPHHPEKSEVIRRILSQDADERMPPPNSHLQLNAGEISLIRAWIEQGAQYEQHWAFLPLRKQQLPKVNEAWGRNAVDRFVMAKLGREHLRPSAEATKETLIRRLSFDLTGLPPSVAEIDAFLHDTSSTAYEKVVDRLLASPAYGERMANDWLDLARYADTYGYQSDVERDMSAWRDWVIRAFNKNLSYDQFVTWQIAGDMLPNATDEQVLATAFNRLHRQTNEGGSIEEEFRTEYCADRVQTFGTTFLGLTLECARCHDHKYDPIKQRDYYSLLAFFNNIDESGLYSHFTRATPSPTLLLYRDGEKQKHAAARTDIIKQENALAETAKSAEADFKAWLKAGPTNFVPKAVASFSFENVADGKTPSSDSKIFAALHDGPRGIEGRVGKALQFDGESAVECQGVGDFKRTDAFSFALWIKPVEPAKRAVVFHHSRAWTDSGSRGYELLLEDGRPSFALIHFWPGNAIRVAMREPLPLNKWSHLTITYDGSSRASGLQIFCEGSLPRQDVIRDNLFKDIQHRAQWGDADVGGINLTLAARFRDAGFKKGCIDEFQIFDRALTPLEIRHLAAQPAVATRNDWFDYFLNNHCDTYRAALAKLKKLREDENQFVNDIPEIMVMKEMSPRRPTFLLKRGSYDAPGDAVEPNTPASIFAMSKKLPRNRLGLARWLVDSQNPLTSRVFVNRVWKMHFGHGLVETSENFGSQGQLPSHPELLDYLAKMFMDSGWNIKALHRLIVMSATYRQTSVGAAELIARDPNNRLLARGPKRRLEAEQIRDAALAVSGLLAPQIGGPSVKPYQPTGLWEQSGLAKTYVQDHGPQLYRRSLYTFWRRTSPPPSMTTFDATSREVCTARRETTVTPLQSLVLLNDPQFVEASRVLAQRTCKAQTSDVDAKILEIFRSILGRSPEPREQKILHQLYQEQWNLFMQGGVAEKYIAIGESARDSEVTVPELAALTVVANTLMNHDEFVMER